MTIALESPEDCNDIKQLRKWVILLQKMVSILRQMEQSNKRMVDYSEKIIKQSLRKAYKATQEPEYPSAS